MWEPWAPSPHSLGKGGGTGHLRWPLVRACLFAVLFSDCLLKCLFFGVTLLFQAYLDELVELHRRLMTLRERHILQQVRNAF